MTPKNSAPILIVFVGNMAALCAKFFSFYLQYVYIIQKFCFKKCTNITFTFTLKNILTTTNDDKFGPKWRFFPFVFAFQTCDCLKRLNLKKKN